MKPIVIGKNIRKWRSFRGKKQETFAKELGKSRVMLSRYENGRSKTSLDELSLIANLLQIKIEDLFFDGENESK